MRVFAAELRDLGVTVVYEPISYAWDEISWDETPPAARKLIVTGLTLEHFAKIAKADVVYVYNPEGYIGNSVTLEMGFAAALHKPIYALEHDAEDPAREILIDGFAGTPEHLVGFLT
jgi:hypothetical protein